MKKALVSAALMGACALATAKLPPLDDAAKAKAAEASARTAWQGKVDAYQLCKSQDKVAAHYRKTGGSAPRNGNAVGQAPTATPGAAPAAMTPTSAPATAAPAPAAAAAPAAPMTTAAAPATPAASTAGAAPAQNCADPGPFAYTPPEQKPLEAAGAHSPAGTASSPPNTRAPEATTGPAPTSPAGAAAPAPAK